MDTLIIPNSVLSIGEYAFYSCTSLKNLTLSSNLLSIGKYAFCYCYNLTSIELPNKLTTLDEGAFRYCSGIASVTIPNSVTSIGIRVFGSCSGLNSIIVASENSNYSSEDGVLFNKDKTTLLQFPGAKVGAYAIPQGVINITQEAFLGSSLNLTSVTIPGSVTSIGEKAFYDCVYFASITCKAVTPPTCGDEVFFEVDKSIPLYVPAGSIAAYKAADVWKEFGNIVAIEGEIPEPCLIASGMCGENLTWELSCDSTLTITGSGAMYDYSATPSNKTPWYENRLCIKYLSLPNELTSIGIYAFYNCKSMISITLPNSVTSIGNYAFFGCSGLTSITIPNSVTSIGNYAFYACSSLTSVTIPNNVTSIGSSAFYNCSGLTKVHISDLSSWCDISFDGYSSNPLYYAKHLYLNETEITDLVIPNNVTEIKAYAFYNCIGLTSVTIPNSVTSIGNFVFSGCEGLTEVHISDLSAWCNISFSGNSVSNPLYHAAHLYLNKTEITNLVIPSNVTEVKKYAFSGCSGLTSITIPNSVTSIGSSAFNKCTGLTSVNNYAAQPQAIEANVFGYIDKSACSLYVPAQSVTAYQASDVWKDFGSIQAIGDSAEITYASIADLYNMAQDSAFTLGAFDVVYVPDFKNRSNMYIKDASGSGVIYKPSYGLQAGDHVEAGLQGKVTIYHGLYEVIPISTKEELTITAGEAPAPIEAIEVPSTFNVNQYVIYKNVSFATDTAFVFGNHIVKGIWNGQEITFYNQYCIGATLSADRTYNITAVNTIYGTSPQAYPLMVEEATPEAPEPCTIASGRCGDNLTWELSCDSVLSISGTGAMTDFSFNFSQQIPLTPWNSYLYAIKSIAIADSVTNIGNWAFHGCVSLTNVTIPQNVVSIGNGAFSHCSGMTSVTIPNSVTSIGEQAFRCCYSLTSVTIPNRVTSIAGDAFSACRSLTSVNIPNSVTNIKTSAFQACSGLISVTIPKSVSSIGTQAFLGCRNLTSITCEAVMPPTCQENVFYEVNKSIPLYVPAQSIDAYQAANVWKEFFNILPIEGSIEPTDSIYNVVYLDQAGLHLDAEAVTLHLPKAPEIEGFTFVGWDVVAGHLEDGIYIQAVYEANKPSNTPAEVPVPGNRAQKLIRNGNVYILTDDKTYTVTGQEVK